MSNHLDYEINKELGECYLFMGDLEKAEEYYRKAAGSNGVHPDPYLGLATIAVQRGNLESALVLYRKAAAIEANDKSLAGMGLVEMETGAHAEAFDHFVAALGMNPGNLVAMNGLLRLGYHLDRIDEVVAHLRAFLELSPEKDNVRFSLAGCLISLGRKDEARAELETILDRAPDHADAREMYALIG
ncbi:tetratricopeptide repeat protein [Nitratidesulfovibrio sp. D1]|uniref:tetratricopeptide repeat protein n=1 Tax=Nitratidesulfovibrio sp. D1 TaxID=3440151 RepID=UPI003EBEA433